MAKQISVAEYIQAQINVCGKSQKVIAEEVGFPKPNVLTMIKQGKTKLPLPRVNALADSLGVNRAKLMRMCLAEYMPEVLEAIEGSLGEVKVADSAPEESTQTDDEKGQPRKDPEGADESTPEERHSNQEAIEPIDDEFKESLRKGATF